MPRNCVLLSVLVTCLSLNYAQTSSPVHEWDFLIFTQSWPTTVCKDWTDNKPSHTCYLPKQPGLWTIHGIWPTKKGTIGPAFCNRTWHFDPEKIKPIESPLLQTWADIESASHYTLWAHEWTKHGTCAAVLTPFNSELKYFSQGLSWATNYSMTNILANANIVPSNDKEYQITDIFKAIKSNLGVNPMIECRIVNGQSWLDELRICFDKNRKLIDCDGAIGAFKRRYMTNGTVQPIITNCNKEHGIIYPVPLSVPQYMPPNRLYVELYKFITWLQWFTL